MTLAVGCGKNSIKSAHFQQSDLQGYWKMAAIGVNEKSSGHFIFDQFGNIKAGKVTNFGVDEQIFTGGELKLSQQGELSGKINTYLPDTDSREIYLIIDAQANHNKNLAVYVAKYPTVNTGIGIMVKREHNAKTDPLEGNWVFFFGDLILSSVDKNGTFSSCFYLNTAKQVACQGAISIKEKGFVTGKMEIFGDSPLDSIFEGQINDDGNLMVLAGSLSTSFDGMATLAVKRDISYKSNTMKGKWKIFMITEKDVMYGDIVLNSHGALSDGKWKIIDKKHGFFDKGFVTLALDGNLSGSLSTSEGHTYNLINGQLSSDGNIVLISVKDSFNRVGALIMAKMAE